MGVLLECGDCGWRGEEAECDRNREPDYPGDMEPKLSCPKCGSDRLKELGQDRLLFCPC